MDIEDILYFLFIAGWAVLGFLKRRKKNQSQAQAQPQVEYQSEEDFTPDTSKAKSFQEIIQELSHQRETHRTNWEESTIQTENHDEIEKYEPETKEIDSPENREAILANFEKSASLNLGEEGGANSELLNDFDLRKAVIYETILNRKYF